MMIIDGFNKLTLLDYPDKVACIIFTRGCNFCCPFCQNSSLITLDDSQGKVLETEVLAYLEKRKNILDGVVISGGEPLIQKDIKNFMQKIKKMGYSIKLDTNGSNPQLLAELINLKLVDYVAMDIKNVFLKYKLTAGKNVALSNIEKSINVLKENKVAFEFRTTIIKEMHTLTDLQRICEFIGPACKYYLQNFEDSEDVINHSLHGFTREELFLINNKLKVKFPNLEIRALS